MANMMAMAGIKTRLFPDFVMDPPCWLLAITPWKALICSGLGEFEPPTLSTTTARRTLLQELGIHSTGEMF
jgi:hypothetical protein